MTLTASTRLGPYEIVASIGAGGMGEVYKARDTRLDRLVALKILPEHLSSDPDRRLRFEREAHAISSLSHPNICSLYDVGRDEGVDYLVMEYLEGESLAQRLSRGPIPPEQALRFGTEIASALDAAHRRGIAHRDLKPGNVVITRGGAKLVDFGLAKLHAASDSMNSDTPTAQAPITRNGALVGTLHYMAPEQLAGDEADARSDVFALGVILYEMFAGAHPFAAASQPGLIAAIMQADPPPMRERNPLVPLPLERAIRKCLAKDPDDRWQSARDLSDELRWLAGSGDEMARPTPGALRSLGVPLLVLAIVVPAVAAGAWWLSRQQSPRSPESPLVFAIDPPPGTTFPQRATVTELAVSPDGTAIAFVVLTEARRQLWVRRIDALVPRVIAGTEGAYSPFWSADGSQIGYFSEGKMMRVAAKGGTPRFICDASGGSASWNHDDKIIFAEWGPKSDRGIQITDSSGASPVSLTPGEAWNFWPSFLPDGDHFVYLTNEGPEKSTIRIGSIRGGEPRIVANALARPLISASGDLVFARSGSLVRQPIDLESFEIAGDEETIADDVYQLSPTGAANFSISRDGRIIAYQRSAQPTQLTWVDRNGRILDTVGSPDRFLSFSLSADGQRVVTDIMNPRDGYADVWLFDLHRGVTTRVTKYATGAFQPIWLSPTAVILANSAPNQLTAPPVLTIVPLDRGSERVISARDGPQRATDLTPDGKGVIFTVTRIWNFDVEIMPLDGSRRSVPLLSSSFNEVDAITSPDGRWLAFASDESGRPEVYVEPYGRRGERVRISSDGGVEPSWSPDGKAIYFIAPRQKMLTEVAISDGERLEAGEERQLFPISSAGMMEFGEFGGRHYQPAPDGTRFLVRNLTEGSDAAPVVVVVRPRTGAVK